MIDRFEIVVPSIIQPQTYFQIQVRALDAQGQLVNDSSTEITLTASDTYLLFDGNEDTSYAINDNVKTLVNGVASFDVFDSKQSSVLITATNGGALTTQFEVQYAFNIAAPNYPDSNPTQTTIFEHPQFFVDRDTEAFEVAVDDPVLGNSSVEIRDLLPVSLY